MSNTRDGKKAYGGGNDRQPVYLLSQVELIDRTRDWRVPPDPGTTTETSAATTHKPMPDGSRPPRHRWLLTLGRISEILGFVLGVALILARLGSIMTKVAPAGAPLEISDPVVLICDTAGGGPEAGRAGPALCRPHLHSGPKTTSDTT
jgi:hypothetical protein